MLMRRITTLLLLFISISPLCFAQEGKGYEIGIKINGLSDSTVYLAYHMGDKQYLQDTAKLDKAGSAVFKGKEALPQGIYMIVLPGRKYFEVLVSADQVFTLSCSADDSFNTLRFSGSDENSAFTEYQRKWVSMQNQASALNARLQKNRQNSDSLKILAPRMQDKEKEMKEYLKQVAEANRGSMLGMLVKAIIPVEIPEIKLPQGTENPDSVRQIRMYLYNKDHYFDNINLGDERILRTPILHSKLNSFFTSVVIPHPDSINKEIDKIIKKTSSNPKVFQYTAVWLFNHFRESEYMGHDAVMVKIADDIYLSGKADWTTKEWRDNLKKEVDRLRPNLIGVKGHDLVMNTYTGMFASLYDIDKDFTILYFWEPDCGHCKEATPKLRDYYEKVKNQGIEVFAVCTQPDKAKWEDYIRQNKLSWINGWDPQRLTRYDIYYNVVSTPTIYILDRDKKIIAKKLPAESIESFIANYRKYNR